MICLIALLISSALNENDYATLASTATKITDKSCTMESREKASNTCQAASARLDLYGLGKEKRPASVPVSVE